MENTSDYTLDNASALDISHSFKVGEFHFWSAMVGGEGMVR